MTFSYKKYILLAIILILFGVFYFSGMYKIVTDADMLTQTIMEFGAFSSIIFVLIIVLEVLVAPLPSIVLYAAGGILYGSFYGSFLILIGNIIGASIAFFLARTYLRNYFEKKIPTEKKEKIEEYVDKYGAFAIFFLRINPITSSDIVSYIAGLTKIRFFPFIIATALGLLPLVFVQAIIGSDFIAQNPLLFQIFVVISIIYILIFGYSMFKTLRK